MIATYREAAERYLPGNDAQNVRIFFSELASTIILKRNLDWLRKFNHHFLKDFQNNKLTSNG
jgi:hypothetical protein